MDSGTLYLIPVTLGGNGADLMLPCSTLRRLFLLDSFIVENAKAARAFLTAAGHPRPLQQLVFRTLNEHTPVSEVPALLAPLLQGQDCGLLSEAGCPAIADPGAALVWSAHAHGVRVVPMVGPSAVLLALMASGMNGQRFVFHGYLPADGPGRRKKLLTLEQDAWLKDRTQIFIEAPYRNQALLQTLLEVCRPDTLLCLATDLTLVTESIRSSTITEWRTGAPRISRRPTVFLIYRGEQPAGAGQKR